MRPRHRSLPAVLLLASLATLPLGAQSAPSYHLAKRVHLEGDGFWDYLTVDPARARLYVTHGTHVMVIDEGSDSVIHDIPNTMGVHGVALAPELGRGFISDGRDSTVTVFALGSDSTLAVWKVTGRNPDAIAYDSVTQRVFTFNGASSNSTVLDANTGRVLATIALDGKPEFAATDGRGRLYVNIENRSELTAIDTRTLSVLAKWPLSPCEEPTGLAMDRVRRRLFSGCGNGTLVVSDPDAARVVGTVPVGRGVDAAAFDPGMRLIFAPAGDGTLTVIREGDGDHYDVVQTVPTQRGARTMALDPRTHVVYSVTAAFTQPEPTADVPRPRPRMTPGSFTLLVIEP